MLISDLAEKARDVLPLLSVLLGMAFIRGIVVLAKNRATK